MTVIELIAHLVICKLLEISVGRYTGMTVCYDIEINDNRHRTNSHKTVKPVSTIIGRI